MLDELDGFEWQEICYDDRDKGFAAGYESGLKRAVADVRAALPHLSPRPDAEVERLRDEAESNQSAYLCAAEERATAERRLAAATALAKEIIADDDPHEMGHHAEAHTARRFQDVLTATPAPAPVDDREALAEWSESDRSDVSAWLTREADQRVKFFPQRRDSVDSLLRHIADVVKGGTT